METAAAPATTATQSAPASQPQGSSEPASKSGAQPPQASSAQSAAQPASPGTQSQTADEYLELDLGKQKKRLSKQEAIDYARIGHAATQRFQEASEIRKQAEAVISRFRDPNQVIQALQDPALGLTKEQIRKSFEDWYAQEFIEPESLTEDQKKLREAQAELKRIKDEQKKRDEERERQERESLDSETREQIQKQIMEALDNSGLPRTNFTIRRLAYWMQRAGKDAPMEAVVGMVRSDIQGFIRDMVEASDGDVLIKLLGDGVVKKLRKHDLEKLRKHRQAASTERKEDDSPSPGPAQQKLTMAEVNDRLRQLQRTGRF